MEHISIKEAQKRTSPNPITLICVNSPTGVTNLTAVSWWTYLSNKPPTIGFAVSKKSYCKELVENNTNLILSIPGKSIAKEAFKCGCVSGKDTNKSKVFGIDLVGNEVKYPVHSKLVFTCNLKKSVDVEDHVFFICRVTDIIYNRDEKQLFSWDGYAYLDAL